MQNDDKKKNDVRAFRPGKLTILQLMGLLAVLGIAVYLIGRWLLG